MLDSKALKWPLTERKSIAGNLATLSDGFYIKQLLGLFFVGAFFLLIFREGSIDFKISRFWFDSASERFPLKDHFWLELLNHRLLKYLIILFSCCVLMYGVVKKRADYVVLALLLGIGALVVALLKQNSIHSCPWSLAEFSGGAAFVQLFQPVSIDTYTGGGKCFPGGHASCGFSLMALFFWFYPRKPLLAITIWCTAVLLGLSMGFGQVVRGAHFFSHNLWSGWWVWASQLVLYWIVDRFFIAANRYGEN